VIGILGLGASFPPDVRTNAWWPPEVVARWSANRPPLPVAPAAASEGVRRVVAAMSAQALDPFQGARERRVAPAEDSAIDLGERASRMAIERAGIDPAQIDLVLMFTVVPDVLLSNPAAILHHRLGLSPTCLALQTEAAAYSFLAQLALAEAMVAAGRARVALLVQASIATRFVAPDDPGSPLFGDGATAVIVGPVSRDRGIEATAHFTDGRYPDGLVMSVPGGCWFDQGRPLIHNKNPAQMREVFLSTADVCKDGIDAVLAKTAHTIDDVDFLCVFQGTPWLREVVHDYIGATGCRSVELFSQFGYMAAAMIPANLYLAEQQGVLRDDDLVVLTGGGTGVTYGATLLRWGR